MQNLKNTAYRWLRSSESLFKTDMVYLAKGGFWLMLGHAVTVFSGLVLSVAFANFLPRESYGTYQYIISLSGILGVLTLTGMGTAVMKAASQNSEGALRFGFHTQLKWSIPITVAGIFGALYYYLQGNIVLGFGLLLIGIVQPFILAFGLYKPFLTGRQLFRESSVLDMLQKTLPLIAVITAIFLTDNLLIIVGAHFLSNGISLLINYLLVVSRHQLPNNTDNELLSYSKHLSVMNSFGTAVGHLDKVLIWHFLGAAPVAVYMLAQTPVSQIKNISQLFLSLIFPRIAKKDFSELKSILPRKISSYFVIILIAVAAYIILAPFLFRLLFPAYPESVIYSQVLALTALAAPRKLIAQAFVAHQMKKEQYILSFGSHMARLVLLVILLPLYGIWGAVSASLGVALLEAVQHTYIFKKSKPLATEQ